MWIGSAKKIKTRDQESNHGATDARGSRSRWILGAAVDRGLQGSPACFNAAPIAVAATVAVGAASILRIARE
jgi:hypothetical protein